ncbi:hypothetical protein MTO96_016838 [Rhipicephalus appendiculatus]
MAVVTSGLVDISFERARQLWSKASMEAATSLWPLGAGWGSLVSVRSNGVMSAGADRCCDAILDAEELPSIYGSVHYSKRGISVNSTASRAFIKCNQEGNMSRDCPNADSG